MAVGNSTTHINAVLNLYRGTNATGFTPYVKLHTGDPGAAGSSNAAAASTRVQATFAAPSGGSIALSATVQFTGTATETISHISIWDDPSAGNFRRSFALAVPKAIDSGDQLNLTTLTLSVTPAAA